MSKGRKTGGRQSTGATAMLTIRIQPELKELLVGYAKEDGRTISETCLLALRDYAIEREAEKAGHR